jgi:hypothetical protein
MFDKINISQILGSFFSILNSFLNFSVYIVFPVVIGLNSFTDFQLQNVNPSFVILIFSPSLPYVIHQKKSVFYVFLIFFFSTSLVLFLFTSKLLVIANMCWLLCGLFSMILYFKNLKNKFYFYTVGLTCVQIATLFYLHDYYLSYLITSIGCFMLIIFFELKHLLEFFKGMELVCSRYVFSAFLRPFFSISFFWQVILLIASHYNALEFLSLTYYSKISLSISVAVFSFSALDLLKDGKINFYNIFILSLFSLLAANILIFLLNKFGRNALNLDLFLVSIFLLLSIFPTLVYNVISDFLTYRIGLFMVFLITSFLIFLEFDFLFVVGVGLLAINIFSYVAYKKFNLKIL